MRLLDFIRSNIEPILDEWDKFAVELHDAKAMSPVTLRDHARGILDAITRDLEHSQSASEQEEKSKGRGPLQPLLTQAELHAVTRFEEGFDVNETIAEFRALRASVLRLWEKNMAGPGDVVDDLTRFNEAIDQTVAESLAFFTEMKERRNRLFEALLANSPDLSYVLEPSGTLVYANQAFADVFRKSTGELTGADIFTLGARYIPEIAKQVHDVVASGNTYRGEMNAKLESGEKRIYEYLLLPVFDPAGRCEAIAGSARDVTERKAAEDRNWRNAKHDSLTGLPNRSLFRERLEHEIKHSSRTGLPLALMFIDLDLFKEVNDELGHAAGDQLLKEVARRISACVRGTDTVARLGGDEFTVILTDVTVPQHIDIIAAGILDELRKPFALDAGEAVISCSIGITVCPRDASAPDDMLRNADLAMYASKNAGRNRYRFFKAAMRGASGD